MCKDATPSLLEALVAPGLCVEPNKRPSVTGWYPWVITRETLALQPYERSTPTRKARPNARLHKARLHNPNEGSRRLHHKAECAGRMGLQARTDIITLYLTATSQPQFGSFLLLL